MATSHSLSDASHISRALVVNAVEKWITFACLVQVYRQTQPDCNLTPFTGNDLQLKFSVKVSSHSEYWHWCRVHLISATESSRRDFGREFGSPRLAVLGRHCVRLISYSSTLVWKLDPWIQEQLSLTGDRKMCLQIYHFSKPLLNKLNCVITFSFYIDMCAL